MDSGFHGEPMLSKAGLWLWITAATAAIAFAGGQNASLSEKGERILNLGCMSCHDLRPIQTQALDSEGWTKIIDAMMEKGAQVKKEDIPDFIEFLVMSYGPLADGAGRKILLNRCTNCHDLKRVKQHLSSPEEWADTLVAMLNEGASLSDKEFAVLLGYLARNFRQ